MAAQKAAGAAHGDGGDARDVDLVGEQVNILATKPHAKFQRPRKRGGRASRRKGDRAERALVAHLQAAGFAAERVPLSGSAGGSFTGDVTVPLLGVDRVVEVKSRGTGFRQLYAWLDGRDLLIVRADRKPPLVVLPLALAVEIAAIAERCRSGGAQ